jgi:hypothetical protein
MGPTAGVDGFHEEKSACFYWDSNSEQFSPQSSHYTDFDFFMHPF